jgi:hypothetical protein
MESEFLERVTEIPELIGITKHRDSNGLVCYSENINTFLIQSLSWIYQNYFSKSIVLFVPKMVSMDSSIKITLEELEKYVPKKNEIVIFAYFELILKDFNRRRLNTLIKNISKKNKVLIISYSSLKYTQLPFLDSFDFYELPNRRDLSFNSLFDLVDPEQETYNDNLESFIEFVVQFKSEGKKVYISLNLCSAKLIEIERLLKEEGLSVSRKDPDDSDVVINSCKTTEKLFLTGKYSVFIFAPPVFEDPVEFISFFKDLYNTTNEYEVFIDSSKIKNISQNLKVLDSLEKRPVIKDSVEFDSYNDLVKESLQDPTMASESYYLFQCPGDLLKLDLGSLTKKEYDLIRNFVKNKLSIKYDIDVKTCQLAAPCSPKDRSKKLNSLSNKISSFDYRCDCTCEIFKDYTIGVIVWNDFFRNRKKIHILKNNVYIYQTTRGTWKYTSVL